MKKNFVLLSIMFFLLFCGCTTQQQTIPVTQRSQTKPIVQEKKYINPDNSLDSQLENLTKQIVNSMTEGSKKKVAVIEFSDLEGNVSKFGKYLSEELITRLFITKKFEVIERRLLNKVLDEQKLSVSDLIDPNSIKELGKILGVDAIVSGTVTDLGTSLKINARIISSETGSVFAVAAAEIKKDETVKKLMSQVVSTLETKKPVEKKPEKVKDIPIEKKVGEAASVFFKEDFSEVEEGMIPKDWIGGEKLMVKSFRGKKFLTNFERVDQTFTVQNVKFPQNFKFEWIIQPRGIHQRISIGKIEILVLPKGPYGANALEFRMSGNSKRVEGNYSQRTIKIGFEKKGPLCRLLIDGNEIFFVRYPDFVLPSSFSFEFGGHAFKLYSIVGTDLGD
ncbi:MAG: FlgO family outer membrane protein [Promethearchaeota archaeon]